MMVAASAHLDRARASVLKLRRAFDARARRERLLLIGAGIAVAWMLGDSLWLTPAFKGWSAARTREASASVALLRLNNDIAQRGTEARSAEQQLTRELAQSRERVSQGDAALRTFGATLVGAAAMVPMLDRLLVQTGGLRMRSVQTLPRSEVGGVGALYRHGVELAVEGSYADVLAYVRAVEAMPQHVLWGGMQLKVEQHPLVVVTLRLYTLSPDRNWLEI